MMYDIKKLEIPKELYSKALEIECMINSEDYEENNKGYELSEDFDAKYKYDIYDIMREYQRREKNAEKPLKQLREQDKNIYRFTFTKGNTLEVKYKCFYCEHIKSENKAIVINSDELNTITFKTIDDIESVVCIERNNNLDYRHGYDWWNEKFKESGYK